MRRGLFAVLALCLYVAVRAQAPVPGNIVGGVAGGVSALATCTFASSATGCATPSSINVLSLQMTLPQQMTVFCEVANSGTYSQVSATYTYTTSGSYISTVSPAFSSTAYAGYCAVLGNNATGPAGPVLSVNTYTGAVILTKGDVGLNNVVNLNQTVADNISSGVLRVSTQNVVSCIPASGSGTHYTCAGVPPPTSYLQSWILEFVPDVNCGSNPDVNVAGLGAVNLMTTASTHWSGCTAGTGYIFYYDNATEFLLAAGGGLSGYTTSGTGTVLALTGSPAIANISPGADFTLTQNSVAVIKSINASAAASTLFLRAGTLGIGIDPSGFSSALVAHAGTDQNGLFQTKQSLSSGFALSSVNDANNLNEGFEIRGSPVMISTLSSTGISFATCCASSTYAIFGPRGSGNDFINMWAGTSQEVQLGTGTDSLEVTGLLSGQTRTAIDLIAPSDQWVGGSGNQANVVEVTMYSQGTLSGAFSRANWGRNSCVVASPTAPTGSTNMTINGTIYYDYVGLCTETSGATYPEAGMVLALQDEVNNYFRASMFIKPHAGAEDNGALYFGTNAVNGGGNDLTAIYMTYLQPPPPTSTGAFASHGSMWVANSYDTSNHYANWGNYVSAPTSNAGTGSKLTWEYGLDPGIVAPGGLTAKMALNTVGVLTPAAIVSGGTKFTISGCSAGTTVGGATAGTFASGTTGTCTVVITMNASVMTAPTGWACAAADRTTPANVVSQTASTAATATLSGTTVSGDVISFSCIGY